MANAELKLCTMEDFLTNQFDGEREDYTRDDLFDMLTHVTRLLDTVDGTLTPEQQAESNQVEMLQVNTEEGMDNFLDNATHRVVEIWEGAGGQEIGLNEKYALNDVLTAFFADKGRVV